MTVRELIQVLKHGNPDAKVVAHDDYGRSHEYDSHDFRWLHRTGPASHEPADPMDCEQFVVSLR